MQEKICFIPARSTSKRFKNKNISDYRDGNLITHTLDQACVSKVFDRIILSSNSDEILEYADFYDGVEKHKRDDSKDTILGVLQDAIPYLKLAEDAILGVLLVTNPLRHVKDIIEAYKLYEYYNGEYPVVSVNKNLNPIQMSFKLENEFLTPVMKNDMLRSTRKQDHYDTYFYNDAIIFESVKRFMEPMRTLYFGSRRCLPYIMPPERSISIDYEFQYKIAKCLGENYE